MPLATLAVIGAVLFGCTSTRTASVRDVRRLGADLERGVALETTGRWRSRLDPNTWVRLENKRGSFSDPVRARDLRVDKRGLFAPGHAELAAALNAVRVEGMSPEARALIEPLDGVAVKTLAGGGLLFQGPAPRVHAWVTDFLKRVAERAPQGPVDRRVRVRADGSLALCSGPTEPDCVRVTRELSRRARWERDMPALVGAWTLRVGSTWHGPLEGSSLLVTLERGVDATAHYPWSEIAAVELTDVSGAKTFSALLGYTAISIAMLPLAALGAGIGALPGKTSASGSSGSSSGSSGGSSGGSLSLGGGGGSPGPGDWTGEFETAPGPRTRRLFSRSARRKSLVRLTLSADSGVDSVHARGLVERLTLGVRLADLVEIGGGVGHAWIPDASDRHDVFGFARLALHLPLDAEHRYALPVGVDFGTYMPGGYLRVKHARLNFGLRRRVGDDVFAGVYLFNPTYVATSRTEKRWSLTSGLEVGAAF